MSLHRVSVLAILLLGVSSTVALAKPTVQAPQGFSKNQELKVAQSQGESETLEDFLLQPEAQGSSWMDQLNLTQEQRQRIRDINKQYSDRINQPRQALLQARQDFKQTMDNSRASTEQIRDKYRQLQPLQQQVRNLQFDRGLAVREVLTPQQRTRYAEIMEQRRNNGGSSPGNSTGKPMPR